MMKIKMSYPSREEEKLILERMGNFGPPPSVSPVLDLKTLFSLRQLSDAI